MSARSIPTVRQKLGCWLHERWRAELVLRAPHVAGLAGMSWMDICNRDERLRIDPETGGRICQGDNSSALTVTRVFPELSARLLQHCLARWPVRFKEQPDVASPSSPEVSIILGVRGRERFPQFSACVAALRTQEGVSTEVIVVEQSWHREYAGNVASDMIYLHQQATDPLMPFNRAWALNGGARVARGRILVLQDADMIVPTRFAQGIVSIMRTGLAALRLPRFIFYLDRASSEIVQKTLEIPAVASMERVIANTRTPIAVRRDAYFAVGGHDESFYGWGAEDDEFMTRLATLRIGQGAVFPIIHLWHPSLASASRDRNAALLARSLSVPVEERIQRLCCRAQGGAAPSVRWFPSMESAAGAA